MNFACHSKHINELLACFNSTALGGGVVSKKYSFNKRWMCLRVFIYIYIRVYIRIYICVCLCVYVCILAICWFEAGHPCWSIIIKEVICLLLNQKDINKKFVNTVCDVSFCVDVRVGALAPHHYVVASGFPSSLPDWLLEIYKYGYIA